MFCLCQDMVRISAKPSEKSPDRAWTVLGQVCWDIFGERLRDKGCHIFRESPPGCERALFHLC